MFYVRDAKGSIRRVRRHVDDALCDMRALGANSTVVRSDGQPIATAVPWRFARIHEAGWYPDKQSGDPSPRPYPMPSNERLFKRGKPNPFGITMPHRNLGKKAA